MFKQYIIDSTFDKKRKESPILESVVQYVNKNFAGRDIQIEHFTKTVERVLKLKPDADIAFQVAAYGHDIERAFRSKTGREPSNFLDPEFLAYHQSTGAEIIKNFLIENGYEDKINIQRIAHLISKHEQGGDEDQTLLMNADSASFMETSAYYFIHVLIEEKGYDKVKPKIDRMYNRMTDISLKESFKELYEKHCKAIESYKD